jgi:hypothetical protein
MEHGIGRRKKIKDRTRAQFQMKILQDLGMEVVQDQRPKWRQALNIQLGEFFDFIHCLSASDPKIKSYHPKGKKANTFWVVSWPAYRA